MAPLLFIATAMIIASVDAAGQVGMNLEGKSYYSQGISFKNRLAQAQPFFSGDANNWSNNMPLDLDNNGYVKSLKSGQIARSLFLRGLQDPQDNSIVHYMTPGEHIFLYEGDCSGCQFSFNAKVIDNSQQGRWILNVTADCVIEIMSIKDPANYPKNFVLVPSQWESSYKDDPWDPDWIKPLNETAFSALRFMDFLQTNGSPNQKWGNRTLPSNYTQADKYGVSWEYIVDLVNRLNYSPWINIPAHADDDYVNNLAKFWLDNYKNDGSKLPIYVEYSNECWNPSFECYHYCQTNAQEMNMSLPNLWYAYRVCQIQQIWDQIWGDKAKTEINHVLGTQEVNTWITGQMLQSYSQCVDSVAIAQYYCMVGLNETQELTMSEDELFDNIESQGTENHYIQLMTNQYDIITNYTGRSGEKLEMVGYEGSWGCTPPYDANRQNLTNLYDDMCLNPRVAETVKDNLEWFHSVNGGKLFNMFSYIGWGHQYGDWGHLEYQDSYKNQVGKGGYKFQGIQNYLAN